MPNPSCFQFARTLRLHKIASLAVATGCIAALVALPAQADITVGVILSLTGPGASLGAPANETVKLWPTTLAGEKLHVIVLDDGSDPTKASLAARKLVTEEHADVLVGSSITPPSLAIVNVAGELNVPLLSLAGGGAIVDPVTGPRRWSFKLSPPEPFAVDLILEHMKRMKVATVGVLAFANSYGDGFEKAFEARAAARGIRVVATEHFSQTDQSTVGQAVKLMAASPDAIFIAAAGTPGALPELDLAARGYHGLIYQTQGVANTEFLRVGGKALEGTYVSMSPMMVAEQLSDADPIKKVALDYVTRYEAKNGANSRSPFGSTAWDFMLMLQKVSETALKAGRPGSDAFRAALRDGLENVKGFVAAEGVINMTPTDHNGVDQTCQVLVQVKDGAFRLPKP